MNLEELEDKEDVLNLLIHKARHDSEIARFQHLEYLSGHNLYGAKFVSFEYTNNVKGVGFFNRFGIAREDISAISYVRGTISVHVDKKFPSHYQAIGCTSIGGVNPMTVKSISKEDYNLFIKEVKRTGAQFKRFKK
jgi:hypothetical protein